MSRPRIAGFRLGVYIFNDAEIVDFAAPYDEDLISEVARVMEIPPRL
jgi:hypothetical protein